MIVFVGILFEHLNKHFCNNSVDFLQQVYSDASMGSVDDSEPGLYSLMVIEEGIGFGREVEKKNSDNYSLSFSDVDIQKFESLFYLLQDYFDDAFEVEISLKEMAVLFLFEETTH